mmetsp:Transcript_86787/g.281021  ORF Transcript_86787/g.281021 Transcript_86787/m.281021 type:complete len:211 (-) Transcript_86787:210-842(-)
MPAAGLQRSSRRSKASTSAASAPGSASRAQPSHRGCRGLRSTASRLLASAPRRSSRQFATKSSSWPACEKGAWRSSCLTRRAASRLTSCCATPRKFEGLRRFVSTASAGASLYENTHESVSKDRKTLRTDSSRQPASRSSMLSRKALVSSTAPTRWTAKGNWSKKRHNSSNVSMSNAASRASCAGSFNAFHRARTAFTACRKPASNTCLQ